MHHRVQVVRIVFFQILIIHALWEVFRQLIGIRLHERRHHPRACLRDVVEHLWRQSLKVFEAISGIETVVLNSQRRSNDTRRAFLPDDSPHTTPACPLVPCPTP